MLTLSSPISKSTDLGNCQSQSQRCVWMGGSLPGTGRDSAHWLVVFVFKKQKGMRAAEAGQAGETQLVPLSSGAGAALGHLLGARVQRLSWGRAQGCRWCDQGRRCQSLGDDNLWAQSPDISSERSFCGQKTFLVVVGLPDLGGSVLVCTLQTFSW